MGLADIIKQGRTTTEGLQSGEGVCDAEAAPEMTLGLQPEVTSEQDIATALRQMSFCRSRSETVAARMDQQIRLVRDQAAQDLNITVDGEQVPIEEYEDRLCDAILSYADAHRDEVFAEGKTVKYSAGELKLRKVPLKIVCEVEREVAIGSLMGSFGDAASTLLDSVRKIVSPWLQIKFSLDLEGIKRAYKADELTEDDLYVHGLRAEVAEKIKAEPYVYVQRDVA